MRITKIGYVSLVVGFLHDSGIFTKIYLIFNVINERGFSLYCTSEVFLQDKIYDVKENMIKTWAGAKFRNIRMVQKEERKNPSNHYNQWLKIH